MVLLDFDHTLFDTDRFFWVDVRAAVSRLGVDPALWEETYEVVWPGGYCIERHVEVLAGRVSWPNPRQILDAFDAEFADLSRYLFPDVRPFLAAARRAGRRTVLLSFGDPGWQAFKVRAAGLERLVDEARATAGEGGKAALAETLVGARPSGPRPIAVDNNPHDLDAMRDRCPALATYRMDRVPPDLAAPAPAGEGEAAYRFREARRYAALPERHRHTRCRNLAEVAL